MRSGTLIKHFCILYIKNIIFSSIVLKFYKWCCGKYATGRERTTVQTGQRMDFICHTCLAWQQVFRILQGQTKVIFQLYASVWPREIISGLLVLMSTIVLYGEGILSTGVWITLWRQDGDQNHSSSASLHGLYVLLWAFIKVAECGYCFGLDYPHWTFLFLWFARLSTKPTGKICSGGWFCFCPFSSVYWLRMEDSGLEPTQDLLNPTQSTQPTSVARALHQSSQAVESVSCLVGLWHPGTVSSNSFVTLWSDEFSGNWIISTVVFAIPC